jgi:hypothetical protein
MALKYRFLILVEMLMAALVDAITFKYVVDMTKNAKMPIAAKMISILESVSSGFMAGPKVSITSPMKRMEQGYTSPCNIANNQEVYSMHRSLLLPRDIIYEIDAMGFFLPDN